MVTQVIKIVGAGQECADLNAFDALLPASLVTADQQWLAKIVGELVVTTKQTISARTTDATRNIVILPDDATGIASHASKLTNPLYYDATKGAAIRSGMSYDDALLVTPAYTEICGLQIKATNGNAYNLIRFAGSNVLIDGCILDTIGVGNMVLFPGDNSRIRNTLLVRRNAGGGVSFDYGHNSSATGCTLYFPVSAGSQGFGAQFTDSIVKDCAIFGAATALAANISASSSNNASDVAITQGAGNQTGITFASQFVSATDFRPKAGGAIIGAGVAVAGRTVDILGQTVSGTPTIGAMEYASAPNPVNADLVVSYDIVAAASADLVVSYDVRAQVTKDLVVSYNIATASASVTSEPAENNNGTAWTTETAHYSWFPGGRVGSLGGITPIEGSKPLVGGVLTVSGLTAGAGLLWYVVRAAAAVDDATFAQHLTAA